MHLEFWPIFFFSVGVFSFKEQFSPNQSGGQSFSSVGKPLPNFQLGTIKKLCNLFGGREVGHQKITLDYRGEGGRSRESKKDCVIF